MAGDLCSSAHCSDLAQPAHDLCAGCLADLQAERDQVSREAVRLTAEYEAQVAAQEPTA